MRAARSFGRSSGQPVIRARRRGLPWVHSTIRVNRDTWHNWSGELSAKPLRLYCDDAGGIYKSPRTLEDLQAIVREARSLGATIRVFGSSHSWSKLVPTGGIIVDNRMIGAEKGVFKASITPAPPDGSRKARATVPPGLLSSELEDWLWEHGYSLPASAFEDCFTIGGMVATATHGAGLHIGTLSDMVVGMTFVDGRGEVRRWSRETATEDELAAIQCGLGCLGLIYDITLEVEPRYEVLHIAKTYPYSSLFADTDEARAALRELHESHTSIEFFWWPLRFSGVPFFSAPEINPDVWVLATKRAIPKGSKPRGALRRFIHLKLVDLPNMWLTGYLYDLARKFGWLKIPIFINCFTNIWVKIRSGAFTMPQYDANHFVNAAGVERVRCIATEWSVPFLHNAPNQSAEGWERARQSFAILHDLVVEAFHNYPAGDPRRTPVLHAVEMRTLASSGALLSPGYQPEARREHTRYAAPEIVTTAGNPAWTDFAHRANIAMTTSPDLLGHEVRCHHGKPCHAFPHPGFPEGKTAAYLRAQYQAAGTWERFLAVRTNVDPDGIFLNTYLRGWFCAPPQREGQRANIS